MWGNWGRVRQQREIIKDNIELGADTSRRKVKEMEWKVESEICLLVYATTVTILLSYAGGRRDRKK